MYGIVCLGTLVACQREPGYKISGSVPGTPDGMKVYLYNWNTGGFECRERGKIRFDWESGCSDTLSVVD